MIQTLIALGVFLMIMYIMVAVTDIERCVWTSIREVGLRNTVFMVMGAVGFVMTFIAALWVLWGFGFY